MSPEGPWEELRREVERLMGLPPGSSDPAGAFLPLEGIRKDARRFEEVLGQGFVDIANLGDSLRLRVQGAMDGAFPPDLFKIPERLLKARPPGLNGFRRR